MIPPFVALSPIFAPLLLEALGPRRARPAARLLASFAGVTAASLGAMTLAGPVAALLVGGAAAVLIHGRAHGASLFASIVDVFLVSLFATVLLMAAHMVVSSPSLSLTTLGAAASIVGVFLLRGGWLALSGVGR
jgi:hypothetical protein